MKMPAVHYHDYLQLDSLLKCQTLRSAQHGKEAHDEHLFIIVHQVYELWFKQIMREIDSIINIMSQAKIDESDMNLVLSRLDRVHEIQKVLIQQIDIMETMTPMDFLEFRDLLYPASGFQSFQFRLIENKLGLDSGQRLPYNNMPYSDHFNTQQRDLLRKTEAESNLFKCIEKWLERTPFLDDGNFNFLKLYQGSVNKMFSEDREIVRANKLLDAKLVGENIKIIDESEKVFNSLFSDSEFAELQKKGFWRLSLKAVLGAMFIHLYRDMPILQLPFRLLTRIKDIDESLTFWRYRHSLMARRMLGTKIGTGGSSGAQYLRESTEKHKIFSDFFHLSTFFIPRSQLPKLPEPTQKKLGFYFNHQV